MHLYLIRHGQSYVNLPDWDGGFIDVGLTPLGKQQAERLAGWLAGHVVADALYSSTMLRAAETAQYVADALHMPIIEDDRLREIGNSWPDASPLDVSKKEPEYADFWSSARPFSPIMPQGETWGDFVTRVGRFLSEVTEDHHSGADDTVLVVCHGGVINAVMDIAFNVGHWRNAEAWIHNTSLTHWEYNLEARRQQPWPREPWRLHGFNLNYHLLEEDGAILGYQWKARTPS